MKPILFFIVLIFIRQDSVWAQTAYEKSLEEWNQQRVDELKAPDGWLNLAGLFWLKPGRNRFGSAEYNEIVYTQKNFPKELGSFDWKGDTVFWHSNSRERVQVNGKAISHSVALIRGVDKPLVFIYRNFRWNLLQRGDKIGIRFRDLESPALQSFTGIDRFAVDSSYKVSAQFVPASSQKIAITNVLGQTSDLNFAGSLRFQLKGETFSLDLIDEGDGSFLVVFGDLTNGDGSYPAGRFLYVNRPSGNEGWMLDFNRAENPPCAYTPYATCPLPPRQNRLPIAIPAGEKYSLHASAK